MEVSFKIQAHGLESRRSASQKTFSIGVLGKSQSISDVLQTRGRRTGCGFVVSPPASKLSSQDLRSRILGFSAESWDLTGSL